MITPAFTLDFTGATLDSRITFSRTLNTATRINSSGFLEIVNADTARFDYTLGSGGACKGLLIEEARTNIVPASNNFSGTSWNKGANTTLTSGQANDPANGSNCARVQMPVGAGTYLYSLNTLTAAAHTVSLFIRLRSGSTNGAFRLGASTTVVALTDANSIAYQATSEWRRFTYTFTATAALWYAGIDSIDSVTALDIEIYGMQVEVGAFATSYIPTTTTALTRNADVATITGTNFSSFWQAGRGGVIVRALPSTVGGTRPLVQFDDASADNIIAMRGNTTNPELYIVDGGASQAQIDAGTIAANTAYSLTGWWQTNDCKARKDSGAVVTDTTATIPTVTQARLGSDGTNYLNGHLATINYYDQFSGQIYTRRKNKAVFTVI